MDLSFFNGKRVFLTGHTGFKGAWLSRILQNAGAIVTGYALEPEEKSLFKIANIAEGMTSVYGDVRDFDTMKAAFDECDPEIVLHLAAQPIVRESYKRPVYTYETNVMGTVNLLECVRQAKHVISVLNVTTDKVYLNREEETGDGYRENEPLDGFDPYANSKSCSELVTHSYIRSFFDGDDAPAVSTARAGNVIGGGDFAVDRIIPDCVRAAEAGTPIIVRHPRSVRPYQHVLEPLFTYLMIVEAQAKDKSVAGCYNVGPDSCDCVETGKLVDLFVNAWGGGMTWENRDDGGPHEATYLRLCCDKVKETFGWKPTWHIDTAVEKIAEWEQCRLNGGDVRACMDKQAAEFLGGYNQ